MERLNLDKLKMLAAVTTLAMFAGVACAEHETRVYGQLNRAFTGTDDGFKKNGFLVDNQFSPTNLGVSSMAHLNKCVSVGGVLETQFNVGNSLTTNQVAGDSTNNHIVLVRTADVWMAHNSLLGKLTLGYGNSASYGITRMSFSGAGDTVSSANVYSLAGGMRFQLANSTTGNSIPLTVFNAFVNPDGVGSLDSTGEFRQENRVRWDSGSWNGLSLAASYGKANGGTTLGTSFATSAIVNNRQFGDVALRFDHKFNDFMVAAGVAYAKYSKNAVLTDDEAPAALVEGVTLPAVTRGQSLASGSLAVEHVPTGINAAVSYGTKRKSSPTLTSQKSWFVQVGKHFNLTHYGKTNLVLDYYQGKNTILNADKSTSYAVGVVQDLDKANTAVYATVRSFKYTLGNNLAGVPLSPILALKRMNVASVGFLFKFGAML